MPKTLLFLAPGRGKAFFCENPIRYGPERVFEIATPSAVENEAGIFS